MLSGRSRSSGRVSGPPCPDFRRASYGPGVVAVTDTAIAPRRGDRLWLVPGHCDPTVNLHDHLIGVRGGLEHGTVERIIRVDARGALT